MLRRTFPWVSLFCLLLAAVAATAQNDIYDNGPSDGQDIAWTVNFGYAVSDSFTLNSSSTLNGLTFTAWLFPGDTFRGVEVAITSSEFGGTTYFDQALNLTESGCFINGQGFNVCTESANFGTNVNLAAGTYWLTLDNGCCTDDPLYWDQNSGPSLASESSVGTIPSESFTLLGSTGTSTGTTPEPSGLVLFASGMLGLAGALRRKTL